MQIISLHNIEGLFKQYLSVKLLGSISRVIYKNLSMIILQIEHKVRSFDGWKKPFDSDQWEEKKQM
jgi:hypothetical protein